jgi:PAS domain S-box-containing protein
MLDRPAENPVQDALVGFSGLPVKLQVAAILGMGLFVTQVLFVASHLQSHLFGHVALTTYYLTTVYLIQRFNHTKLARLLEAVDHSSMVAKFSLNGVILSANGRFCETFGYQPHDLVGKEHVTLVTEETRCSEDYLEFWAHLRRGQSWHGTYERLSSTGKSVWVVGSYTPIRGETGAVLQILKVARDVTDQIEDQFELQNKNTYLEHAAKILRHDMHSGINTYIPRGIRSLERRLEAHPDVIEDLQLEMPLKLLKGGLEHTQKVYLGVREFTNLVKPGSVLTRKRHHLGELLEDYLASTAYKRDVIIGEMPVAEVNGPLFCTAVDNLIRNGLKYNDSPSKQVRVEQIDPRTVGITDNGRGMDQKDFERYSKPYVRKEGQVESGTGLGLNICIAILREHRFAVSCEKLPTGTLIRIQL